MTTYTQLGRLGDLCNASKICLHEYRRTGERVRLVVAREFAPFLTAFSYIEPIVFEGTQDELPRAMAEHPDAIVLQSWMNPELHHETDSYQKEAWRRAGKLDAFGTAPLWLDNRNRAREARFARMWPDAKPLILVATQSPSSPFMWGQQLITALWESFSETHLVVDLSLFLADAPQDLLGLLDRAALLVTIDSFPLHLAEASTCPVIAIVNDLGTAATPGPWAASVPPPQAIRVFGYHDFGREKGRAIAEVVGECRQALIVGEAPKIIHACQLHDTTARHVRAMSSWIGLFGCFAHVSAHSGLRTAKEIGDARNLPYLRDVLKLASAKARSYDIIFWCNDDNVIDPKLPAFLRRHLSIYDACSFRRTEPGTVGIHIGREGFAFTLQWLTQNWDSIPDYILGASSWDIGLAALIRLQRGIVTTKRNLTEDRFPCDVGEGYVFHEAHASAWSGANENCASNQHNRRLLAEWQKKNIPQVREVLA